MALGLELEILLQLQCAGALRGHGELSHVPRQGDAEKHLLARVPIRLQAGVGILAGDLRLLRALPHLDEGTAGVHDAEVAIPIGVAHHVRLMAVEPHLRILEGHLADLRVQEAGDHRRAADVIHDSVHVLPIFPGDVPLVLLLRYGRQVHAAGAGAAARGHHLHADQALAIVHHHQVDRVVFRVGGNHYAFSHCHYRIFPNGLLVRLACSASHGLFTPPSIWARVTNPVPRSN
ncbi:hypothetical protein D3C86_1566640 [compost metagenome]